MAPEHELLFNSAEHLVGRIDSEYTGDVRDALEAIVRVIDRAPPDVRLLVEMREALRGRCRA